MLAEPLVDLGDARSHDDIADRIAARAAEGPPGEWIMTTPVGEPHYFIRSSYHDRDLHSFPTLRSRHRSRDRRPRGRGAPGGVDHDHSGRGAALLHPQLLPRP